MDAKFESQKRETACATSKVSNRLALSGGNVGTRKQEEVREKTWNSIQPQKSATTQQNLIKAKSLPRKNPGHWPGTLAKNGLATDEAFLEEIWEPKNKRKC